MDLFVYDKSTGKSLAGYNLISSEIHMPRIGIWTANVIIDTDVDFFSGTKKLVVLSNGPDDFNILGTAYRSGIFANTIRARLISGYDGLNNVIVDPKAFDGCTLRSVINDTLAACGEKEIDLINSDSNLLDNFLVKYVRLGGQLGGASIVQALSQFGADVWRFNINGSFICYKTEPWPASTISFSLESWNREDGFATISYPNEEGLLVPGTTIVMDNGSGDNSVQQISYVIHTSESKPTPRTRSKVYFEDQ